MKEVIKRKFTGTILFALAILALSLTGCGGGGETLSTEVVSGVAAVGLPLAGEVRIKDSSSTPREKTAIIDKDGSFAFDVTGMTPPYILQARGSAEGREYKLHSFAERSGIANVNPLSDVIVACAAEVDDPAKAYDDDDSERRERIKPNLEKTVNTILIKLQPLLARYGAERKNPITSKFIANHLDLDEMFDEVSIRVKEGMLSIVNEKTDAVIYNGKVSDIANGNFYPENVPPAPNAPLAPTGVSAAGGIGQVSLAWSPVSNAISYNVYYATSSGVTSATGTKVSATTNSHLQTGLTAGATYYFVVTAVNSAGESAASAQVQAASNAAPPVPTAPAAPTGVSAVGGTHQATISWPAVTGATSYNIYWSKTSGVTTATGTKLANAASPAVQAGLTDSTTYYYIVTAVNGTGESAPSIQVAATTLAAVPVPSVPAAVTGLTATGGANQVSLSWSPVSGATSYNVYWSNSTGVTKASGTRIAGANSPYVHTGLSAGATYYYVVTAVNSVGESLASPQASAGTYAPAPSLPAAPTGVTATGGANQVSVNWTAVTGAVSYNLYWSTVSGVTTATGTKITGVTRPYVQTGLTAGTTYYYLVTAVSSAGESPASARASAATNAPTVVVPAAPSGFGATGGTNQVTITWQPVSSATSYNVYYSTTTGVTKANGAKIVNAATPYTQTGLAAGTTYFYVVTAVNSAGESAASAQFSATTTAVAPPPPLACGTCHAIPPATGKHAFHTAFTGCATCHGTGYSSTTVNAATHANGVKNLGGTSNWNATTRSCSNACHGNKAW